MKRPTLCVKQTQGFDMVNELLFFPIRDQDKECLESNTGHAHHPHSANRFVRLMKMGEGVPSPGKSLGHGDWSSLRVIRAITGVEVVVKPLYLRHGKRRL